MSRPPHLDPAHPWPLQPHPRSCGRSRSTPHRCPLQAGLVALSDWWGSEEPRHAAFDMICVDSEEGSCPTTATESHP